MRSRTTAATTALALAAIGLVACAPSDGGADGATLEFQTNLAAGSPILDTLEEITTAFESEHEGVEIELVPTTNTYEADLKVRLASGDVPDIWSTHGWSLLRYAEFLEPLSDRPWAAQVDPALDAVLKDAEGEFYALPINTDIAGIVYNASVLEGVGVDPATLTTWEAFDAAAAKIQAAGIVPISSSGKDSWFAGNVADFIASGAYTQAQLDAQAAGEFQTAEYTTMLDQIDAWAKAGHFNPDFTSATQDDLARALAQGDTAFVFVQNYLVTSALELNPDARLGYLPVPGFVSDPYFVGGEGYAYGVAKDSPHKDTALAYLDFLAQPDNLSRLAQVIGSPPGLTDATVDLGPLQSSYDEFVADGRFRIEPYFDRVYLPNGGWDTLVTTTSAVITGQSDVATAVGQVHDQFTALSTAR